MPPIELGRERLHSRDGCGAVGAALDHGCGVRDRRAGAEGSGDGDGEHERALAQAVRLDVVEGQLELVAVEGEEDVVAARAVEELLELVVRPADADRAPLVALLEVEEELRRAARSASAISTRETIVVIARDAGISSVRSAVPSASIVRPPCVTAHKTGIGPSFFPYGRATST